MAIRMAFINERNSGEVAINVDNVSSIRMIHGVVYIHLCGDKTIATEFRSIQEAWDAVNI
tara:strand:- start:15 stop:194 length:180 start_codon:yes stop_codon:yes gene_type:complete